MAKAHDEAKELDTLAFDEEELRETDKKYTPDGFETVEDYLADLRENYELDLQADDDNRIAAMEDKKFVAGQQWDPEVLQSRTGLPCLVINTIPQFTAQLTGDWRTNRTGVKVIPSETGDKDVASIRSDLVRSIWTKNRGDRVLDDTFESMVQCGDGAFRVGVQYCGEDVFDQEIVLQPVADALSVVWDRLSLDATGRDATRCFVDDLIPAKEFKKKWPDADPSNLNSKERRAFTADGWIEDGDVHVTEHWRMIERHRLLGMFEDGSIHTIEGEDTDLDKIFEEHGKPIRTRVAPCLYAQMHLVTGWKILAGPYEYKMNRLPIIRMAGRTVTVGDKRVRFGLVRFMKDAARLRNFWRSVAAEQLGYAPKAQWIANEKAVEGREEQIRKAHLTRDPLIVINDDAQIGHDIQRVDPPAMQMALLNEAQVNTQDMKDVTGIHDASLGIKSNETSGRAIMARQREGDVASLTYYDNGNAAVLEAGDVINQLIGQIYDGTRIIRVIGEDEATRLVHINDPMNPESPNIAIGNYDVTITTGASYTTRRVEAAQAMMEAIQVYPELMQVAGDLVVKAQDWPGAEELSARLTKTIPPQLLSQKEQQALAEEGGGVDPAALQQQMAEGQEQMQKMGEQLQKLETENVVLKTKHDIEMQKLEIDKFSAETDRIKVIGEFAKADEEFKTREFERDEEANFKVIEHAAQMDRDATDDEHRHLDRDQKAEAATKKASSDKKASSQPSK